MGVPTNKPESDDSPVKETKQPSPPPPPPKEFRILNTSAQTLYLTLPGRTLVLDQGTSQDVPESDIAGNHHVRVMVRRGHIALFEKEN